MGLRLTTLGRTELVADEKLPPGLTMGRPLMLLVFLALEGRRPHSRQALGDLLWGDHDEAQARRALRQALYIVRKVLPADSIDADPKQVRLVGEIPSDARDLEEALRLGDADRVAALYRGAFLVDLPPDWPRPFLEWVEGKRARYDRLVRHALLDVAEAAISGAAIHTATELLEAVEVTGGFDLACEMRKVDAWLTIGRAHVAAQVAQRALDRCIELEVDVPREARARLESAALVRRAGHAAHEEGSVPGTPQLAGRARERVALLAAWRRAVRGEGLTALVLGDPGIGKSRLIEEVAVLARSEGATVLKGRGYALESGLLYGALIEVLRLAISAPGFAGVADVWLTELSRLLPELTEKYPNLAPPGPEESGGRRRFYESVAQVFEALAFERPVFCVLDDLHWTDEATLELLHYLGRRLCACHVLFVAGVRPGEATAALRRLQETLVREQGGIVIELEPLDRNDTRDLVSSMFGFRTLPEAFESLVWSSSEGNPLFAVSMVELLSERRCVQVQDGWLAWDEAAAATVPRVSQRVRELIEARLRSLPPEEADVLCVGAVAGRAFTNRTVASVLGRSPDGVDDLLFSLARRRIVQLRSGDGDAHWEFTHDRLREVVYDQMTQDRRAALHGAVARATEGEGYSVEPGAAAWHASLAGDRALAFQNALQAAAWARSVFAFDGARDMLRVAWANAPDPEARRRVEEELTRLPPESLPPAPSPGRWRVSRRAVAVAVVSTLVVVGAIAWSAASSRKPSAPAPLPSGLLVRVIDGDSEYFGLVDPERPGAPVERLPDDFLPVKVDDATFLSPDGDWVATWLSPGRGDPPDVYAIRRDGSDTLRLTDNPEDDIPMAWFPDSRAVLVRTGVPDGAQGYAYHLSVASLEGPARMLNDSMGPQWASVHSGAVSPDGARIAAAVTGAAGGIWVMDADGANARRIREHPAGRAVSFSPDGRRLAFLEGEDATRLVVASLTSDSVTIIEPPGVQPGRGPVWGSDGHTVYLSAFAEGSQEVFAVPVDGSEIVRLTFSSASEYLLDRLGSQPPYVDRVEIISSLEPRGELLAGDSAPLRAIARDSAGALVDEPTLRVSCTSDAICTVRGGWLRGLGPGATQLVASAGGWRADTLSVTVVDPTPRLELGEDWEAGILTERWQTFGVPEPVLVRGEGHSGSQGFQANGNNRYESGVVTRRTFSTRRGLTIEFSGRGEFETPWPSWQYLMAGVTGAPLSVFVGDGPHVLIGPSVDIHNTGLGLPPSLVAAGRSLDVRTVLDPREWHRFTLQVFPTGESELWVDADFLWRGSEGVSLPEDVRVVLQGRATHGLVIHDDVKVYEGILLRR